MSIMFFNQSLKNDFYTFYIIKSDNIKITVIYGRNLCNINVKFNNKINFVQTVQEKKRKHCPLCKDNIKNSFTFKFVKVMQFFICKLWYLRDK